MKMDIIADRASRTVRPSIAVLIEAVWSYCRFPTEQASASCPQELCAADHGYLVYKCVWDGGDHVTLCIEARCRGIYPRQSPSNGEALCYNSEDTTTWLQVVDIAQKMGEPRVLRFALESLLSETLRGVVLDEHGNIEDLPILPPVAYKALEGLSKIFPKVHDEFSYDSLITSQTARAVGIKQISSVENVVKTTELLECGELEVDVDSWYGLGGCLSKAYAKLYSLLLAH
jgi:hypothetical protein